MAKPRKPGGPKQKLSPAAAARKKRRDTRKAKTEDRKAKKAENQRRRRKARGKANGKDFDHKRGKFVSVKSNRGNQGKGTKKEGGKKYKITTKK